MAPSLTSAMTLFTDLRLSTKPSPHPSLHTLNLHHLSKGHRALFHSDPSRSGLIALMRAVQTTFTSQVRSDT